MQDFAYDWTVACIRLRIMMLKRGIKTIPIVEKPTEIERFIRAVEAARASFKNVKKNPPLENDP